MDVKKEKLLVIINNVLIYTLRRNIQYPCIPVYDHTLITNPWSFFPSFFFFYLLGRDVEFHRDTHCRQFHIQISVR